MRSKWILAVAAGALLLPSAVAQRAPVIRHRKHVQQHRIAQGVRSGALTRGETARLERRERALNRQQRRMKADGKLTPRERARLTRQQNHLSRQIYRAKHNDRTR